jgi:hypothetical protein
VRGRRWASRLDKRDGEVDDQSRAVLDNGDGVEGRVLLS